MNDKQKMYALKYIDKFDFICVSNTLEELDKKVNQTFWEWKGIQSRDNKATLADFLSKFIKVSIMVEREETPNHVIAKE